MRTGIITDVIREIQSAEKKFPAMRSAHEGYAILLEEVRELEAEVFRKEAPIDRMRKEAIQVAAMALRFVSDVCSTPIDWTIKPGESVADMIDRIYYGKHVGHRDPLDQSGDGMPGC